MKGILKENEKMTKIVEKANGLTEKAKPGSKKNPKSSFTSSPQE